MEEKKPQANHVEKIMGKLEANRHSLHMKRVPLKTKEAFRKLSDEEFCGDYGMTLKFLMDGVVNMETAQLMAVTENHEARIVQLESQIVEQPVDDGSTRTMLDKSVRKVKGGN